MRWRGLQSERSAAELAIRARVCGMKGGAGHTAGRNGGMLEKPGSTTRKRASEFPRRPVRSLVAGACYVAMHNALAGVLVRRWGLPQRGRRGHR